MLLERLLTRHWLIAFTVMCVSALLLGLTSINLFFLFKSNITLVADNGVMALFEGALEELCTLTIYGIASVAFYLVFKVCEKILVDAILK